MSSTETKLIQQGLRGLDHDPGPVDGLFGARTRAAAEAWLAAGGRRAARGAPALPPSSLTIHQGAARHPVREIIVHCAATRPEWMVGHDLRDQVAEIRRWHRAIPWRDIGYHWVIGRAGGILPGRAETEIGAGVAGRNNGVIHICLIGGHGSASTDRFSDHFTDAQAITLHQQISAISMRSRIDRISGHNEWAAKACPGFNVSAWLKEVA